MGPMRTPIAFVALLLVACGPATVPEPDAGPTCELEPGTYRSTWARASGDCPELAATDVILGPGEIPGAGDASCSGPVTFTDDGCAVEYDVECDVYDDLGFRIGHEHWQGVSTIVAPQRIEGSVSRAYTGVDPSTMCTSVYDIAWVRR